jgi:hypothetical protein
MEVLSLLLAHALQTAIDALVHLIDLLRNVMIVVIANLHCSIRYEWCTQKMLLQNRLLLLID